MPRVIRCDCGFESTGDTDDALVANAQAHARAAHDTELADGLVRMLVRTTAPEDPPTNPRSPG